MNTMRALIVVRLSRMTDETTSPERQLAKCREVCAQRSYEVVGVAEDLDVSAGSTSPFERPQLGQWLDDPSRLDVVVFFRADRIVRRLFDLADLIRWARRHDVTLVSASESHFDLSTDFGDIIALLVAKVAEMELAAISERNASAFRHNFAGGKWRGGTPPWGFLPRVDDSGDWRLVQDPEQVSVIHEVVDRVLAGEPLTAVARDLTAREIPTPRDRFAISQGREPSGYTWHSGPLKRSLKSETLLGYAVTREALTDAQGRVQKDSKGRKEFGPETAVRGDDGSPIVRSEPVLTREVFDRVGKELSRRENKKSPGSRSNSLLLQVIFCGVCGLPAYKLRGAKGRQDRYRCRSVQEGSPCCGSPSTPVGYVEEAVEKIVLRVVGDSERMVRVWDAGDDTSGELADVEATLTDLASQLGSGVYRAGTPQRKALDDSIARWSQRFDELSQRGTRASGWTWSPTGQMFGEWWAEQGVIEKNVWLRRAGVTVTFRYAEPKAYGDRPTLDVTLGDVPEMLAQLNPSATASAVSDALRAIESAGLAGAEINELGEITLHEKETSA